MKRKISLLALLFLLPLALLAQTDYVLEVTDSITGYCSFNKIEILDARKHKEDFGYLKTGPFNAKTLLVPKAGVEELFRNFITRMTAAASDVQPNTLLLVLKDYKITDRPVAGEMGTFYARINFYLGTANGFEPLFAVDSFFETGSGWDVTKAIKRLASGKMTNWVKLAAANNTAADAANRFSLEQITNSLDETRQKYKIYSETPQKGIYYTQEQFLNNTPGATDFIEKRWNADGYISYTFYTKKENGKKGDNLDKIDCFAVYNGEKWFKKTSLGVYEMKYKDNDYFYPEAGRGLRANDGMVVMFGLAGALLTSPNAKTNGAVYRLRYDPETNGGHFVERLQ